MTPGSQRIAIAIAEACGWMNVRVSGPWGMVVGDKGHYSCVGVPDYLNDLNAMHEAEKTCLDTDSMNPISYCPYADKLQEVCFDKTHWWCATAAQRAEALLKTLGLWKD